MKQRVAVRFNISGFKCVEEAAAAEERVAWNLDEDIMGLNYTCSVVTLFWNLARLWRALKYGGDIHSPYRAAMRLAARLNSMILPAGSCWPKPERALKRIRFSAVMDNIRRLWPDMVKLQKSLHGYSKRKEIDNRESLP